MRPHWGDVNARVRGMGAHFLGRTRLVRLTRAATLDELTDRLAEHGVVATSSVRHAYGLEIAVRRWASHKLDTLSRWAGSRREILAVIFEDEDRRSLRAVVRGAVQGADWQSRLAGLVPTPSLGPRALETLAHQDTVRGIAATLAAWRNPYGDALIRASQSQRPDLLALEGALNRTFLQRGLAAARRGGRHLRAYAAELVDIANAWSAMSLGGRTDVDPETLFVDGGADLSRARFLEAVHSTGPTADLLATRLPRTALGKALAGARGAGDVLERSLLTEQIVRQRDAARLDPLGTAPIVGFMLRLRAESNDVRRIAWGVSLGASPAVLEGALVTPA